MTNRQQRRISKKENPEGPKPNPLPNLSGDHRCCGNCRFARVEPGIREGESVCFRFPPQINSMSGVGQFPVLKNSGWCGEHKE